LTPLGSGSTLGHVNHLAWRITVEKQQPQDKEYTKPEIADYGDLQELTANRTTSGVTDVPKGTPGPNVFS
jgi:hypothetical protein